LADGSHAPFRSHVASWNDAYGAGPVLASVERDTLLATECPNGSRRANGVALSVRPAAAFPWWPRSWNPAAPAPPVNVLGPPGSGFFFPCRGIRGAEPAPAGTAGVPVPIAFRKPTQRYGLSEHDRSAGRLGVVRGIRGFQPGSLRLVVRASRDVPPPGRARGTTTACRVRWGGSYQSATSVGNCNRYRCGRAMRTQRHDPEGLANPCNR